MNIEGERDRPAPSGPAPSRLQSLLRHATSFPGFHALNAGLALIYNVAQTVVLARTLGPHQYAATVAMTAVSLYVMPINQAVARASFLNLREKVVSGAPREYRGEAAAIFNLSQTVMLVVALAAPAFVAHSLQFYASLVGFTFFGACMVLWATEIQMVMLAVDRAMSFERANLAVRIGAFAALLWLILSRNFLSFSLIMALLALVSHLWAVRLMIREGLLGWSNRLSLGDFKNHLQTLWTSLQATFGEWITLNASYAIFTARYGVGPPLVALDATMKVLRFVLGVTRASCEVMLPRLSKDIINRRLTTAFRLTGMALGVCLSFGAAVGVAIVLFEHRAFSILLGPNNVVPAGAGMPVALSMIAGVCFQVGSMVVGFFAQRRVVKGFTAVAIISSAGLALAVFCLRTSPLGAMWCFAVSMVLSGAAALIAMTLTLKGFSRVANQA